MWQARQELNACQADQAELLVRLNALANLEIENEQLKQALQQRQELGLELRFARLTGRDLAANTVRIDLGAREQMSVGLPVITANGELLGQLAAVFTNWSQVKLITARDSSFVAEVAGRKTKGIVRGQGGSVLLLREVPRQAELAVGDVVLTSAIAESYPPNLLLGKISELQKMDIEPFQGALVEPFIASGLPDNVFVVTGF